MKTGKRDDRRLGRQATSRMKESSDGGSLRKPVNCRLLTFPRLEFPGIDLLEAVDERGCMLAGDMAR